MLPLRALYGSRLANLGAAQRALSSQFLAADFVDRMRTAVRAAGVAVPIEPFGSEEPTTIKPKAPD